MIWENFQAAALREVEAALAAEIAARRRHWIGGVPTPSDITGIVRDVAHRLRADPEEVRAALPPMEVV